MVDVEAIYGTSQAWAALHTNGEVTTWGSTTNGGTAPSLPSLSDVQLLSSDPSLKNRCYRNQATFTAVTDSGLVAWGPSTDIRGKNIPTDVKTKLDASQVDYICSTNGAFTAVIAATCPPTESPTASPTTLTPTASPTTSPTASPIDPSDNLDNTLHGLSTTTSATVSELTKILINLTDAGYIDSSSKTASEQVSIIGTMTRIGQLLANGTEKQTISVEGVTVVGFKLQPAHDAPIVIDDEAKLTLPFGDVKLSVCTFEDVPGGAVNASSELVFVSVKILTAISAEKTVLSWKVDLEVSQLPIGKEFKCVQVGQDLEPILEQTCKTTKVGSTKVTCSCIPVKTDSVNLFMGAYVSLAPSKESDLAKEEEDGFPVYAIVLCIVFALALGVLFFLFYKMKKGSSKKMRSPKSNKVGHRPPGKREIPDSLDSYHPQN